MYTKSEMSVYSYESKFNKIKTQLLNAFATFHVWKALQVETNKEIYKDNIGFWSPTIPALEREWLITLARLFEDSRHTKRGDTLSIYSLITEHPDSDKKTAAEAYLLKNKNIYSDIKELRDKHLAHNDLKALMNVRGKGRKLTIGAIEDMLNFTNELLKILDSDNDRSYSLSVLKQQAETDTEYLIIALKYFHENRDKYLSSLAKGI